MPTFYVVTPSYNQAVFLNQTLQSLVSQTGVKVVSLVQDGGSSDDSVKVLKKYGSKISWVSKKDKGQSDALNQGLNKVLKLSKNPEQDIFAYLNSDDYYQPQALERVATYFAQNPTAQWLIGECQIVDEQGQEIQTGVRWYKALLRGWLSRSLLLVTNPIPQPAVFMRVAAAQQTGMFETKLRYTMDYQYWLRLWTQVGAPLVISDTLAAFRIHKLSKGGADFRQQFDEELRVAKDYTQSSLILGLHALSNLIIKSIYSIIK